MTFGYLSLNVYIIHYILYRIYIYIYQFLKSNFSKNQSILQPHCTPMFYLAAIPCISLEHAPSDGLGSPTCCRAPLQPASLSRGLASIEILAGYLHVE
jgi:hypothetical protein